MTIGQIIKRERKNRKLTQRQLSSLCGASGASICGWEHEKHIPNMSAIVALTNVFGMGFFKECEAEMKAVAESELQ